MLNGLDLFSGIGGLTLALDPWVRPVAYCEKNLYAQAVLLSRQAAGELPVAPIWDDVASLRADMLPAVDLISAGFPCQDISVAGTGKGLEGKRSGLFFQIVRLVRDLRPAFVFLENVPAISTRGLDHVCREMAALGYDCRWLCLRASSVGAPHVRNRWFLLATDTHSQFLWNEQQRRPGGREGRVRDEGPDESGPDGEVGTVANANGRGLEGEREPQSTREQGAPRSEPDRRGEVREQQHPEAMGDPDDTGRGKQRGAVSERAEQSPLECSGWWASEPDVGRMAHGIPNRVDRLRALGNAVVPLQAREAFKALAGIS